METEKNKYRYLHRIHILAILYILVSTFLISGCITPDAEKKNQSDGNVNLSEYFYDADRKNISDASVRFGENFYHIGK